MITTLTFEANNEKKYTYTVGENNVTGISIIDNNEYYTKYKITGTDGSFTVKVTGAASLKFS